VFEPPRPVILLSYILRITLFLFEIQGLREFVISFSISFTKIILSRGSETFVLKFKSVLFHF